MKNIKGFIDTSFVDWPGRSCAVLFLGNCNFRCPYCHNHPLVNNPDSLVSFSITDILAQLKPLEKWLGGICISGGEPTLDLKLPVLIKRLRREGYKLKIDTNGSHPERLKALIDQNLLQMISMDVKAPLDQKKYEKATGTAVNLNKIRESIKLIKKSGIDHEFRMTVLPGFHSNQDLATWAEQLGKGSPLRIQNFNPDSVMNPETAGTIPFKPDHFRQLEKIVAEAEKNEDSFMPFF